MARLDGKVAIVTGSGGGIGREHARLLAAHGASVVVNDIGVRTGADAASVVAEIEGAGGTAIANTTSATWDGAASIVQSAIDAFGRIDIVVNNATANGVNDIWRLTEQQWDLAFDVNLKGYFAMIRAAAPHLCAQGSGAIVNTSSGSGFGHPSHVAYASAKEGVVGLTRTVAKELGRFGVRCNAIRPFAAGASTTDYAERTARWSELMALTMGPTPGTLTPPRSSDPTLFGPAKISPLVVWLCTDAARDVNGRTFHIAGDTLSRLSEPTPERSVHQPGGWELDDLDSVAAATITGGLTNPFALTGQPHLQVFEE